MIGRVEQPEFLYDVGSPWCWLAAERVTHALGVVPVWLPVLESGHPDLDRAQLERAALDQGLPEPRWPEPFPFDSRTAMLAATFAKQTGRAVAYSLAAMRQAFAAGRDLSVTDNVLIAAAACELHPRAVLKALDSRTVQAALREAAHELPAIRVGDALFTGPHAVEEAAALLPR
jgi:2-hydroxychromene-2-carboxylate isomerase